MKPLVTNASDPKQVKEAEKLGEIYRDRELNDIAVVCSTKQGRRLLWRILTQCKTFESIWDNSARIHYRSGQQDLGHFLMSEIVEANEDYLFQMMRESKEGND